MSDFDDTFGDYEQDYGVETTSYSQNSDRDNNYQRNSGSEGNSYGGNNYSSQNNQNRNNNQNGNNNYNNGNNNNYQNRNNGNSNGGNNYNGGNYNKGGNSNYNNGNGGQKQYPKREKKPFNKEEWLRKKNTIEDPYMPVTFHIPYQTPSNILDEMYGYMDKFLARGYTVRVNGDDPAVAARVKSFGSKNIEIYIPFDGWEGLESEFSNQSKTIKHITETKVERWDSVFKKRKFILYACVASLFGDAHKSRTMMMITWTKDGASHKTQVSNDTGQAKDLITICSDYEFRVLNMGNENFSNQINKLLSRG